MANMRFKQGTLGERTSFLNTVSRYSRFVRLSKWSLIALIIIITATLFLLPTLRSKMSGLRITLTTPPPKAKTENVKASPSMVNPKLEGVDNNQQPFTVTAKSATQKDTDTVILTDMQADLLMNNQSWLTVLAKEGVLQLRQQVINLQGKVQLYTDSGYEFSTEHVKVQLMEGTAEGESPIQGNGPLGNILAKHFAAYDQGKRIVFSGGVHVVLYPKSKL